MKQTNVVPAIHEITFSHIFLFFKRYWIYLFVAGILSGMAGYGVSYLFSKEYTVKVKILPEYSPSVLGGGLNDLASLVGLSTRNRTDAVRPDLYPEILRSTPFLIETISKSLPTQEGKRVTLIKYFDPENKVKPLTQEQFGDSMVFLSKEQKNILSIVSGRLSVDMGKLTGIISLQVTMPDPVLAAAVANQSITYLRAFVDGYKTDKERAKVVFLEKQVIASKQKYERAETALSVYRDRNLNPFTNSAGIEEQRLQGEFVRTQAFYNELARQLEAARLLVREDTPILEILEPPVIPTDTSSPRRLLIAAASAILGGFVALLSILMLSKGKIERE